MKSLRLLSVALLACACTTSAAVACDNAKSGTTATTASTASSAKVSGKAAAGCCAAEATALKAAHSGCTAEMAAQCTPAMRAACEKNAAVAAAMGCSMKGSTSATTASVASVGKDVCQARGAAAVMAADGKCDTKTAAAKHAACARHGSATAAGMEHCAGAKGTTATTASTAGMPMTAASAGMKCSGHLNAVEHDCSACEDWAKCEQDVRSLGAKAQVVALKNGAMIVYTSETESGVKALQSMVAKRNEHLVSALSAGSDRKLCDECKHLRGAMASGKLHREVVNVERGCMTLITSNDRGVVQMIRAMTGQPVAMR